MRALVLEPDPQWLAERSRLGLDRFDEVWDGVLHVVPFPSRDHQYFEGKLERVITPIAERLGLDVLHNFGVYDPSSRTPDLRGPDLLVVDPKHVSQRGVEGRAELVIEILSPNDESREKLPFYAKCKIPEVWLIDPVTRAVEVHALRKAGYEVVASREGIVIAPCLGVELRVIDGPKLRVSWAGGTAEV